MINLCGRARVCVYPRKMWGIVLTHFQWTKDELKLTYLLTIFHIVFCQGVSLAPII